MKTKPTEALKLIDETESIVRDIEIEAVNKLFASLACKLAFKEGQSNPKIKQLEWDFYGLYYDVKTPIGHYMILQRDEQYLENRNTCTLTHNGNLIADFNSIEEAQSTAQKHFEARIKECLIIE